MSKGSLINTKNRVKSIGNTSQITKAMELISSSKFKKSLSYTTNLKKYFSEFKITFSRVMSDIKNPGPFIFNDLETVKEEFSEHDYKVKVVNGIALIAISSDRGLCGSYNNNVIKELKKFLNTNFEQSEIYIFSIGKKVNDFLKKNNYKITAKFENISEKELLGLSETISHHIIKLMEDKKISAAYILYSDYEPSMGAKLMNEQLLPISIEKEQICMQFQNRENSYIFEPKVEEILELLIPKYITLRLSEMLFSSMLSEHYSRMVFMKFSHDNAVEIIGKLNINLNKERQGLITKELLEVINAVESLDTNLSMGH